MGRWVRYDEATGSRLELDQEGIKQAARKLLEAIRTSASQSKVDLAPLVASADAGRSGRITSPRNFAMDPLSREFGERTLPEDVGLAYATFTFYTHGRLEWEPQVVHRNGQAFVHVDDD
jgi:hypothetical protein